MTAASKDPTFFTSRPWLQAKIDGWLSTQDGERVLVISGGPGTGKSRFLHQVCLRLAESRDDSGARLGGAILRDLRGNRCGELSWSSLKKELLELVGNPPPAVITPSAVVNQKVGLLAPGAQAVGQMITAYLLNQDPVGDLRETVLPQLAALPAGPPLVVVVDGLDEAFRDHALDFLTVVSRLADAISRAPHGDRGVGRLRLVVASQPEVPIDVTPIRRPVIVDLAQPDKSDEDDLAGYCSTLLVDLPEEDRERLARQIARSAAGVWVWAFYVGLAIKEDFANGKQSPLTLTSPRTLAVVYREALDRARGRLGDRWQTAASLIALIAAAQDVGTTLPKDIATAALETDGASLARLLGDLKALIAYGVDGKYQFWHGDFGRWIADGGYELANLRDAHDRLTEMALRLGRDRWSLAGSYGVNYVMPHALATAELDLGTVRLSSSLQRCLRLAAEIELLKTAGLDEGADGVRHWLDYIERLSHLAPANTRIAGSVPLTGLSSLLYKELQRRVGRRLAGMMTEAQLDEFESLQRQRDEHGALELIKAVQPSSWLTVAEELRLIWERVLSGWRPENDTTAGLFDMGFALAEQWRASRSTDLLTRAIDAYLRALDLTSQEDLLYTSRMISLANAYVDRIGNEGEQPDDLDRLIALQADITTRPDLHDPASALAVHGLWLRRRWQRDPASHAADLDGAVAAYQRAIELTPDDHEELTDRMIGLANACADRIDTEGEQPDDLDRLIALQADITTRPDLHDPASALAVQGFFRRRRWQRDPASHAADLDGAVAAYQRAIELTPDDARLTARMIGLANACTDRIDTEGEQPDDLDRLIALQADITTRPDLHDPAAALAVHGLWLRRRWQRDPASHAADLDGAVAAYQRAIELTPDDHEELTARMIGLANACADRIDTEGEQPDDLDRLIALQADITTRPDLHDPAAALAVHGLWLRRRWQRDPASRAADLDGAVAAYQRAIELTPDDHEELTARTIGLANACADRIDTEGEQPDDLDRLIALQADITTRPDLHDPASALAVHGLWLRRRWQRDPASRAADLDGAVAAYQRAIELTPDDARLTARMIGLANACADRIDTEGEQPDDLDRLIALQADITTRPDLHDPASALAVHGFFRRRRWQRDPASHAADLDGAVAAYQRAIELTPDGHEELTDRMIGLANAYTDRIDTEGEQPDDLDRLIALQADITTRPDLHDPASALAAHGFFRRRRWQRDPASHAADLDGAVAAYQRAIELTPDDHEELTDRMIGLANAYTDRIDTEGEQPDDLDRLIALQADITTRPDLHDRASAYGAHSYSLRLRWNRGGDGTALDIHAAVEAGVRAVEGTPNDDPHRTDRLFSLANALIGRLRGRPAVDEQVYEQAGDLDHLLSLQADIVARHDLQDPASAEAIYATWQLERWRREPDQKSHLRKALVAAGKAVDLTPDGDAELANRLVQLANLHLLGHVNDLPGATLLKARQIATSVADVQEAAVALLPALRRLARQVDGVDVVRQASGGHDARRAHETLFP
ncbi:DUF5663 domain-containing protein [Micromonospora sp. IBSANI012]|uniref:DUF5663 domain-containing protein n=1 Tax=Micromonospora sp. IBSANI012 TaxID=3457761 RepID=UPI004058E861